MGTHAGPKLVTGSMSFYIDAANKKSLTTIGTGWRDLTGKRPNTTFANATFSAVNGGIVFFGGTNSSSATVSESFFSTSSRTFDVWVKKDQNVSSYNMVWGYYVPYLSMHTSSKFLLTFYRNEGAGNILTSHYSNQSHEDGRWYNVTCTIEYNLGVYTISKIYIDGVMDSIRGWNSATTAEVIVVGGGSPQQNLILGAWHVGNPDTSLRGSISNFRIYDRVLTDAEILQNYNAMAPRFRSDVAERATLHLDAANSNSFTRVQNGWADLSTLTPTFQLSGATYDSSNGGIINFAGTPGASASAAFNQSTEMTWDVWFKRTSIVGDGNAFFNMVFEHGNTPYLSFGTGTNQNLPEANQFVFSWYTKVGTALPQQNWLIPSTIYSNNVWYNVTCTLKHDLVGTTSTGKMYVNGTLVGNLTTPLGSLDQIWPNSPVIRLATFNLTGQYPFNGSISNLKIYRRILTDAEILQNYNALKARFGY